MSGAVCMTLLKDVSQKTPAVIAVRRTPIAAALVRVADESPMPVAHSADRDGGRPPGSRGRRRQLDSARGPAGAYCPNWPPGAAQKKRNDRA